MGDQRYLVVGGTGYIGARIAQHLSRQAEVVVTQRSQSEARSEWLGRLGLRAIPFDSAKQSLIDTRESFDAIINLAMPGAAEAARDPEASRANALKVARACLRLMDEDRADRLLHFSSFHVYGGSARDVYSEMDSVDPTHPYGRIHLQCEQLALSHPRAQVFRPSNIVATPAHRDLGDQAKLLALDLCRQAAQGAICVNNDGMSYRDFLPFDDLVAAVTVALAGNLPQERLFNVAHGRAERLDAIAQLIRQAAERTPTLTFGSGVDTFRQPFSVDTQRLQSRGWQPAANLSDEVRRTVAFFA